MICQEYDNAPWTMKSIIPVEAAGAIKTETGNVWTVFENDVRNCWYRQKLEMDDEK